MNKSKRTFVKFIRNSEDYFRIIEKRPSAFVLLSLIANRARRTNNKDLGVDLEIGEALIGDYSSYSATQSIYRTDVKFLQKHGFILKTRTSRRGTVVKLVNTEIFDICPEIFEPQLTSNKRINFTRENKYTKENITGDNSLGSLITLERDNTGGRV